MHMHALKIPLVNKGFAVPETKIAGGPQPVRPHALWPSFPSQPHTTPRQQLPRLGRLIPNPGVCTCCALTCSFPRSSCSRLLFTEAPSLSPSPLTPCSFFRCMNDSEVILLPYTGPGVMPFSLTDTAAPRSEDFTLLTARYPTSVLAQWPQDGPWASQDARLPVWVARETSRSRRSRGEGGRWQLAGPCPFATHTATLLHDTQHHPQGGPRPRTSLAF